MIKKCLNCDCELKSIERTTKFCSDCKPLIKLNRENFRHQKILNYIHNKRTEQISGLLNDNPLINFEEIAKIISVNFKTVYDVYTISEVYTRINIGL